MQAEFVNGDVHLTDDGLFSPEKTFDCGQCFRFSPENGGMTGIAYGRRLHLRRENGQIILEKVGREEYERLWKRYLDLERDYASVNALLSENEIVAQALEHARGIRILRQEPWEALCSFLLSQNNNIPRIRGLVEALCSLCGTPAEGGGYAFPTPEQVLDAGEDKLTTLRAGYRTPYLTKAARDVATGKICLEQLAVLPYDAAREAVMSVRGVGPKVADCVLLFGCGRLEAFPRDVWIRRVLEKRFPPGFDPAVFDPYGGIAQQYLFYAERYGN